MSTRELAQAAKAGQAHSRATVVSHTARPHQTRRDRDIQSTQRGAKHAEAMQAQAEKGPLRANVASEAVPDTKLVLAAQSIVGVELTRISLIWQR